MTQHLITRDQWGAREQDGTGPRALPVREWWAHHSVTVAPDLVPPFTDDDAAVRTLERIGEDRFGAGISYTFPITPAGRCYEGHGMDRVGTHTRGHNTIGAAIVFVGDYSTKAPTPAAQEAAARRMVIEHRAGRATTHRFNGGHTQAPLPEGGTAATACPGAGVLAALPAMNARAEALWAAGYPTTEEDDMPTTDEIARAIFDTNTTDENGDPIRVGTAIGRTYRNGHHALLSAREAARDAAVARALAEATATATGPLTVADITAISRATVAAVDAHLDARDRALAEALANAGEEGPA